MRIKYQVLRQDKNYSAKTEFPDSSGHLQLCTNCCGRLMQRVPQRQKMHSLYER